MYATFTLAAIDTQQEEAAVKALDSQVVNPLQKENGFLSAYFTQPQNGLGQAVSFWETQQNAIAAAGRYQPGTSPMPGVVIVASQTSEIIASAQSENWSKQSR